MKPITFSSCCASILIIWLTIIKLTHTFNLFRISSTVRIAFSRERVTPSSLLNSHVTGIDDDDGKRKKTKYVLGPKYVNTSIETALNFGSVPPARKPEEISLSAEGEQKNETTHLSGRYDLGIGKNHPFEYTVETYDQSKKMVTNDAESRYLSRALWLYGGENKPLNQGINGTVTPDIPTEPSSQQVLSYEDVDQSIPLSVFNPPHVDLIWDILRDDALREAQREPLLVSFLYSSILNHPNLESALAFHLANRLASPSMISTQIMSLILEALDESPTFRKYLRADLIAVRDRDPACTCLPDVFLHFKGFHALQSQRVAHYLWKKGRKTLAHFFQSQVSQHFQIDIHPNATLGSGIMLDHGTGLVIGETATVGHNCSILHHVTLGGSGKRGIDRHPKVGNGVLLGAGASVLGNIKIGDGCQVGAGTLVIGDLKPHSIAVGVPARVIGTYKDVEQPSQTMDQVGSEGSDEMISYFQTDGI